MIRKLLCKLLASANSCPPPETKEQFYAVKERILRRWGELSGRYDVQEIEGKKCWSCGGTGVWQSGYNEWQEDGCHKCYGSGWYKSPVWVLLERWRLAGRVFLRPSHRVYALPEDLDVTIRGYVEHEYQGNPKESVLWLFLLYDRRAWWKTLTYARYSRWRWTPMLFLNCLIAPVAQRWRALAGHRSRKCWTCRKKMGFRKGHYCRLCTSLRKRGVLFESEAIPF